MSKNYIKEFLKDNELKVGEKFKAIAKEDGNVFKDYVCSFSNAVGLCIDGSVDTSEYHYIFQRLILGEYKIEKIKPKTLLEQLKEQGYGFVISATGDEINRAYNDWEYWDSSVKCGNVFLTKSEAEREVYRRRLEFEMQEWAREHDCLLTIDDVLKMSTSEYSQVYNKFNVYVPREFEQRIRNEFAESCKKYYNW